MEAEIEHLFGESTAIEDAVEKHITYKDFLDKINQKAMALHKDRMKAVKAKTYKMHLEADKNEDLRWSLHNCEINLSLINYSNKNNIINIFYIVYKI